MSTSQNSTSHPQKSIPISLKDRIHALQLAKSLYQSQNSSQTTNNLSDSKSNQAKTKNLVSLKSNYNSVNVSGIDFSTKHNQLNPSLNSTSSNSNGLNMHSRFPSNNFSMNQHTSSLRVNEVTSKRNISNNSNSKDIPKVINFNQSRSTRSALNNKRSLNYTSINNSIKNRPKRLSGGSSSRRRDPEEVHHNDIDDIETDIEDAQIDSTSLSNNYHNSNKILNSKNFFLVSNEQTRQNKDIQDKILIDQNNNNIDTNANTELNNSYKNYSKQNSTYEPAKYSEKLEKINNLSKRKGKHKHSHKSLNNKPFLMPSHPYPLRNISATHGSIKKISDRVANLNFNNSSIDIYSNNSDYPEEEINEKIYENYEENIYKTKSNALTVSSFNSEQDFEYKTHFKNTNSKNKNLKNNKTTYQSNDTSLDKSNILVKNIQELYFDQQILMEVMKKALNNLKTGVTCAPLYAHEKQKGATLGYFELIPNTQYGPHINDNGFLCFLVIQCESGKLKFDSGMKEGNPVDCKVGMQIVIAPDDFFGFRNDSSTHPSTLLIICCTPFENFDPSEHFDSLYDCIEDTQEIQFQNESNSTISNENFSKKRQPIKA